MSLNLLLSRAAARRPGNRRCLDVLRVLLPTGGTRRRASVLPHLYSTRYCGARRHATGGIADVDRTVILSGK